MAIAQTAAAVPTPSETASFLDFLEGVERERAATVLERCRTVSVDDGVAAVVPPAAALVVVEHGAVALIGLGARERRRAVLAFARDGDVLVPPASDEALIGLGGATLRIVDRRAQAQLLAAPRTAEAVVESLVAVLRDRQESLAQFADTLHRERLRRKLLQLGRTHGRVGRDGIRIDLPLTHQLLAQAVGSARETVTVALRDLRDEGFLVRRGRSYLLKVGPRDLL